MALRVFVSRSLSVLPEFDRGLDAFQNHLRSIDLEPVTLGASDYANENPLDEIVRLMRTCVGAFVLGYPDYAIHSGTLRGQSIDGPLYLATEWNQIKAAIAYLEEKPLLVVHNNGVKRGFFDRGAFRGIAHEVDLTEPDWAVTNPVLGAIKRWKERIEDQLEGIEQPKAESIADATNASPQKDMLNVLWALADLGGSRKTLVQIAGRANVHEQSARYFLDQLTKMGCVTTKLNWPFAKTHYITDKGRELLIESNML